MIYTNSLNRLMAELNAMNWSFIYENAQLGYTDFINILKRCMTNVYQLDM